MVMNETGQAENNTLKDQVPDEAESPFYPDEEKDETLIRSFLTGFQKWQMQHQFCWER